MASFSPPCHGISCRCLGPGTMEGIVAREAEELIQRVEEGVRKSPGAEKFNHNFCKVQTSCFSLNQFFELSCRCSEGTSRELELPGSKTK